MLSDPPKISTSESLEPVNMLLYMPKGIHRCDYVKDLRWEYYPKLAGWAQCNHRSLKVGGSGVKVRKGEVEEMGLLIWKMKRGMSQGMWAASSRWKRQETFSLRNSGKSTAQLTPWFWDF